MVVVVERYPLDDDGGTNPPSSGAIHSYQEVVPAAAALVLAYSRYDDH